jgi:hypothetical protein
MKCREHQKKDEINLIPQTSTGITNQDPDPGRISIFSPDPKFSQPSPDLTTIISI